MTPDTVSSHYLNFLKLNFEDIVLERWYTASQATGDTGTLEVCELKSNCTKCIVKLFILCRPKNSELRLSCERLQ